MFKISLILFISCFSVSNSQAHSNEVQNAGSAASKKFLKQYAGTYQMGVAGQAIPPDADEYVLTPNGKFTRILKTKAGTEKKSGTWKAEEGLIHFDGIDREELMPDWKWENGVFKSEGVYLKKKSGKKK
jgi:hypothetical protein